MNTEKWFSIAKDSITVEITEILTAIDTATASRLPRLGLLRYHAKLEKVELVELVKKHGDSSRKAFENAKFFADVLCHLPPDKLPQHAYEGLTYRKATELAKALNSSKDNAACRDAVSKYLGTCKFKSHTWADEMIKRATPATAGESATAPATAGESATAPATAGESATAPATAGESATAPATAGESATAPATAGESATAPATAPATAQDVFVAFTSARDALKPKQREALDAMMIRFVENLASSAPATNILPMKKAA